MRDYRGPRLSSLLAVLVVFAAIPAILYILVAGTFTVIDADGSVASVHLRAGGPTLTSVGGIHFAAAPHDSSPLIRCRNGAVLTHGYVGGGHESRRISAADCHGGTVEDPRYLGNQ